MSTPSSFEEKLLQNPEPKKIEVITPIVVSALDRTKTSSRNASHILIAAASSLGVNINKVQLSGSAIHRKRIQIREKIAMQLKSDLRFANCLVVHWDGILLPSTNGSVKVDKLPVVVTGLGTEQLLGVLELDKGTGINQTTGILRILNEWNISHRIKAMCFDTTSTNTGRTNGTCALLEKELDTELLYFACRHHICELVLRGVFDGYWPTTSGPDVLIFKRFQDNWASIDKMKFETYVDDSVIMEKLGGNISEIQDFITDQLKVRQPRDDNRELLELSMIFLGQIPPQGISFKRPGAMSHARWLSKALYSLKIFLFRNQFKLNKKDIEYFREICIFVVKFYIKSWFTASSAIKAPQQDLELIQNLIRYQNINPLVSKAALSKLENHLWYLSEDLSALSFFDETVPVEIKLKMVQAIHEREPVKNRPRDVLKKKKIDTLLSKHISDFVTQRSLFLFQKFGLSYEFLKVNPELWPSDNSFKEGLKTLLSVQVVNDVAERNVATVKQFNGSLTKDPVQQQLKQHPATSNIFFKSFNTIEILDP